VSSVYCDKNLEQGINIKFCVNSASETLAILTLAYGEYATKKWSVLNGIGGSREGEEMCKRTHKVGSQKTLRIAANVDRVRTSVRSDRRLCVRLIKKYSMV
jgi:hypothetical protein